MTKSKRGRTSLRRLTFREATLVPFWTTTSFCFAVVADRAVLFRGSGCAECCGNGAENFALVAISPGPSTASAMFWPTTHPLATKPERLVLGRRDVGEGWHNIIPSAAGHAGWRWYQVDISSM